MPEVLAIYNAKDEVYHNNSECPDRKKVTRGIRFGTGGKKLCPICDKLTKEGK